jgi:hypothetical protein
MSSDARDSRARGVVSPHNRFGVDYREEAARLGPPVVPIIDIHSHIHGAKAAEIYDRARRLFGVTHTFSMTQIDRCAAVRDVLGDSITFMSIPSWSEPDKGYAHREGYLKVIERYRREFNAPVCKIWSAPRLRELVTDGAADVWSIDAPWRVRACEVAQSLGMMFMVHVADPDTWFGTRYADASTYGTKRSQYEGLERMLERFPSPWIAAHMGGWPEDLEFLSGLLSRHDNLYLDTSATKWVVRELSKHPREKTLAFFARWNGRILFGSDLVTSDDQLAPKGEGPRQSAMSDLASSPEEAFDLYCSRYYALRLMLEGQGDRESPIADPDLKMVNPARFDAMSAPTLRGIGLPADLLRSLYRDTAEGLVLRWMREHP